MPRSHTQGGHENNKELQEPFQGLQGGNDIAQIIIILHNRKI